MKRFFCFVVLASFSFSLVPALPATSFAQSPSNVSSITYQVSGGAGETNLASVIASLQALLNNLQQQVSSILSQPVSPYSQLAQVAPPAVGVDAVASAVSNTGAGSLTYNSGNTSAGATLLIIGVTVGGSGGPAPSVTGVTYGGTPLSFVKSQTTGNARSEMWSLASPASGVKSIVVSLSGATESNSVITSGAVSFLNSDTNTPLGTAVSNAGNGTAATVNVTDSTSGDMVVDVQSNGCGGASAGANQTEKWKQEYDCATYGNNGGGSTEAGAVGTVTMSWSISSDYWSIIAVTVKQARTLDTQPPSVPLGLTAISVSASQINLAWTASTDNVGVAGYKIFRGGTQVGTSATNSYSDAGLTASTSYLYTVSAYDAAGNNSAQSSSQIGTTGAVVGGINCDQATLQAAINSAVSGATINCNAGNWSGNASIPSSKGITINGNGSTHSGSISFTPNATVGTRITGFTFTGGSGVIDISGGSLASARWRIDHNTFTGNGHDIVDQGVSPGLFDHNTFTSLRAANEFVHILGWGAVDTTGWTNAHAPGSSESIYFEDNVFTTPTSEPNNAWIQSYYGARSVYRYNTFNYTRVDAHGTPGSIGARWWEFYNNTFTQTGGNAGGSVMNLRAGSGIVFNNTKSGTSLTADIGLCEEDSGYPALYQIGRGQNQILYPAYIWGNTIPVNVDTCEAPEVIGMVAFNRDVYRDVGASCVAGGSCTSGVGTGTTLPTSCTINTGFWKTDAGGNWNAINGTANDGALYKCSSTNVWTLYYTPFIYPYPLDANGLPNPSGGVTVTLSITKNGTGTGTVTSSGGSINCGSTCSVSGVTPGTVSTLTAVASSGSTFTGWSGGACSGTGTCTLTLNTDTSVTATFDIATPSGQVIDPSRRIDWSTAGVTGGIPNRTTICATFNPGATASQINAQLGSSACANKVVQLNAGTYNLNVGLTFGGNSNVTLRGAGADKTKLIFADDDGCQGVRSVICIPGNDFGYYGFPPAHSVNWTAGYAQGTTQITLSATTGLSVGMYIVLDQLNDASDTGNIYVCSKQGTCTDEGGGGNGRADRGNRQMTLVTAINGNTVTISPGVYMPNFRANQSPQAWWGNVNSLSGWNGIEDLSVDNTNSNGVNANIALVMTHDSWVKGVRSINAPSPRSHIEMYMSAHDTVRDSYIVGSQGDAGMSTNYGIEMFGTANILVENNISQHRTPMIIANGDVGSVYGYNFAIDDHYGSGSSLTFMQGSNYSHDVGNGMDLHEGNSGVAIMSDNIHGTSNLMTMFRNYMVGWEAGKNTNTYPVVLTTTNRYYNFVGNVLGKSGYHTTYQGTSGSLSIWSLGGASNFIPADPLVAATTLRWGNYDTVTGAARFVASEVPSAISVLPNAIPSSQTIPSSLYLSARPLWWGSMPWPAIGPDVSGGNISGLSGHAYKIPAQLCWENAAADPAYAADPASQIYPIKIFTPSTCYSATSPTSVSLTVSKNGTGTGTVTSSGGSINCGSTCSVSGVTPGTVSTLTAVASSGSTFTGWSV